MNIYLFLRNKCSWKYEWNESSDSCRFFAPLEAASCPIDESLPFFYNKEVFGYW